MTYCPHLNKVYSYTVYINLQIHKKVWLDFCIFLGKQIFTWKILAGRETDNKKTHFRLLCWFLSSCLNMLLWKLSLSQQSCSLTFCGPYAPVVTMHSACSAKYNSAFQNNFSINHIKRSCLHIQTQQCQCWKYYFRIKHTKRSISGKHSKIEIIKPSASSLSTSSYNVT